jgi:hypothetical protein
MIWVILANIGLTFILKYGHILKPIRDYLVQRSEKLDELFKCSLCLGFWSGVILLPFTIDSLHSRCILAPLISAACSWTADSIVQCIQQITVKLKQKDV